LYGTAQLIGHVLYVDVCHLMYPFYFFLPTLADGATTARLDLRAQMSSVRPPLLLHFGTAWSRWHCLHGDECCNALLLHALGAAPTAVAAGLLHPSVAACGSVHFSALICKLQLTREAAPVLQ
jgi:hypothetical protein